MVRPGYPNNFESMIEYIHNIYCVMIEEVEKFKHTAKE